MKQKFVKRVCRDLGRMSLVLIVFLVLWQIIITVWHISSPFAPSPLEIGAALSSSIKTGELTSDVLVSLQRALTGFVSGSLIGILVGILTGRVKLIDHTIG